MDRHLPRMASSRVVFTLIGINSAVFVGQLIRSDVAEAPILH